MDHALTRRGLLGGLGAAGGGAAPGAGPQWTAPAAPGPAEPELDPTVGEPLVAGLAYQMVGAVAFPPRDFGSAWQRGIIGQGAELANGGSLTASINVPVGAVIKQVTLF